VSRLGFFRGRRGTGLGERKVESLRISLLVWRVFLCFGYRKFFESWIKEGRREEGEVNIRIKQKKEERIQRVFFLKKPRKEKKRRKKKKEKEIISEQRS